MATQFPKSKRRTSKNFASGPKIQAKHYGTNQSSNAKTPSQIKNIDRKITSPNREYYPWKQHEKGQKQKRVDELPITSWLPHKTSKKPDNWKKRIYNRNSFLQKLLFLDLIRKPSQIAVASRKLCHDQRKNPPPDCLEYPLLVCDAWIESEKVTSLRSPWSKKTEKAFLSYQCSTSIGFRGTVVSFPQLLLGSWLAEGPLSAMLRLYIPYCEDEIVLRLQRTVFPLVSDRFLEEPYPEYCNCHVGLERYPKITQYSLPLTISFSKFDVTLCLRLCPRSTCV